MHISTIGLLTILLPCIAVGAMQEATSWNNFESMMKNGGSYCLMLVFDSNKDEDIKFMQDPCRKFPSVKCYYGMEAEQGEAATSFDEHFKNKEAPAFFFFKNGRQVSVIVHVTSDISLVEIEEGFKSVQ